MTSGGFRAKAGRKPATDPKQRLTIFIPKSITDYLNREKCREVATSAVINEYNRARQ